MSGAGSKIAAVIPAPNAPLVNPDDGTVSVAWRAWFLTLQRRTGGTTGTSVTEVANLVSAGGAAGAAADQALRDALAAETAARMAEDNAEHGARVSGDQYLFGIVQGMVPIEQLCQYWAQCDFSFLPTADPGNGQPWNDGGHIAIGSSGAMAGIGLEDDSGTWLPEDGAGTWQWG
jgi:hypothetical protein